MVKENSSEDEFEDNLQQVSKRFADVKTKRSFLVPNARQSDSLTDDGDVLNADKKQEIIEEEK